MQMTMNLPTPDTMITMWVTDNDTTVREPLSGHYGLVIDGLEGWEHFRRMIDGMFVKGLADPILEVSPPEENGVGVLIRR